MISPAISLIIPILMLIFPFFIIKFGMGEPISFALYKKIIMQQLKNHSIGKMISYFSHGGNWDKKITYTVFASLYFISLYQNVLSCIKFYKNCCFMHYYLFQVKEYLSRSSNNIHDILDACDEYSSFNVFTKQLIERNQKIEEILHRMQHIESNTFSFHSVFHIGKTQTIFLELHENSEFKETIEYCIQQNVYLEQICNLQKTTQNRGLGKCKYSKSTSTMKDLFHVSLFDTNKRVASIVKNNISIKNNYIITGPNASGKTTLVKSVLLNQIMSQQFGFGCYSNKTKILPMDYFYSYLNIPDTSSRESLFQAEVKRCIEVLKNIKKHKKKRHFAIFDEIFSGTNYQEATVLGKQYLKKLHNNNVFFLMTTHYHDLTQHTLSNIQNISLGVIETLSGLSYTYKIQNKPCFIKGGFESVKKLSDSKILFDN